MTLPIATGKWVIDPTHSSIGFIAKHLGFTKVRGSFEEYSLEVNVGDTLENSSVSTTVNLNSVNTSNADRDEHLKGADFLVATKTQQWSLNHHQLLVVQMILKY